MNFKSEKIFNKKLPSHEQILFGLLLSFVGGYFDAYSFINSDGRFANAQTGNLIFVGIELSNKNYMNALHYIPPILFFIVGVIFNKLILNKNLIVRKYINLSLLIQILLLIFIFLFPFYKNVDIRPLIISFVCAMQFDSFRTINNIPFASIFCTGNLRSASEHIYRYLILKDKSSRNKIFIYTSIILFFIFGVISGGIFSNLIKHKAIVVVIIVLLINFVIAIIYDRKLEK